MSRRRTPPAPLASGSIRVRVTGPSIPAVLFTAPRGASVPALRDLAVDELTACFGQCFDPEAAYVLLDEKGCHLSHRCAVIDLCDPFTEELEVQLELEAAWQIAATKKASVTATGNIGSKEGIGGNGRIGLGGGGAPRGPFRVVAEGTLSGALEEYARAKNFLLDKALTVAAICPKPSVLEALEEALSELTEGCRAPEDFSRILRILAITGPSGCSDAFAMPQLVRLLGSQPPPPPPPPPPPSLPSSRSFASSTSSSMSNSESEFKISSSFEAEISSSSLPSASSSSLSLEALAVLQRRLEFSIEEEEVKDNDDDEEEEDGKGKRGSDGNHAWATSAHRAVVVNGLVALLTGDNSGGLGSTEDDRLHQLTRLGSDYRSACAHCLSLALGGGSGGDNEDSIAQTLSAWINHDAKASRIGESMENKEDEGNLQQQQEQKQQLRRLDDNVNISTTIPRMSFGAISRLLDATAPRDVHALILAADTLVNALDTHHDDVLDREFSLLATDRASRAMGKLIDGAMRAEVTTVMQPSNIPAAAAACRLAIAVATLVLHSAHAPPRAPPSPRSPRSKQATTVSVSVGSADQQRIGRELQRLGAIQLLRQMIFASTTAALLQRFIEEGRATAEAAFRALVAIDSVECATGMGFELLAAGQRQANEAACHVGCDLLARQVAAFEAHPGGLSNGAATFGPFVDRAMDLLAAPGNALGGVVDGHRVELSALAAAAIGLLEFHRKVAFCDSPRENVELLVGLLAR